MRNHEHDHKRIPAASPHPDGTASDRQPVGSAITGALSSGTLGSLVRRVGAATWTDGLECVSPRAAQLAGCRGCFSGYLPGAGQEGGDAASTGAAEWLAARCRLSCRSASESQDTATYCP